jgi:hypothetical protein
MSTQDEFGHQFKSKFNFTFCDSNFGQLATLSLARGDATLKSYVLYVTAAVSGKSIPADQNMTNQFLCQLPYSNMTLSKTRCCNGLFMSPEI